MAADIDALLAKYQAPAAAPDIDALLAKHREDPATVRARLVRAKLATDEKLAELEAQPNPLSIGSIASDAASSVWDRLKSMGKGALSLAQLATGVGTEKDQKTGEEHLSVSVPFSGLMDGSKRRQIERGLSDTITGGYATKAADAISPQFAASEAPDQAAAPDERVGGQLLGFAAGGLGRGVMRASNKAAQEAIVGGGALKSAARAAGAYELSAPTLAAAHADSAGNRLGAASDAAMDMPSVALAAAGGASSGELKQAVDKSKGGQAAKLLEDNPRAAERIGRLPANDRLIGSASRQGAEGVYEGIETDDRFERKMPYQGMKAVIDASPEAFRGRDVQDLAMQMQNAIYDLSTDSRVRKQLKEQLRLVKRYETADGVVKLPEYQLNGLRQNLMRMAKVGMTDAPEGTEAPLRAAAFAARDMVDQGPYGELNRTYTEDSNVLTRKRQQLGLKKKPSADRNVDIKKIKLAMERDLQNTKTAGGDSRLGELAAEHPQYAEDLSLPKVAQARADLTPRLTPQHGGLIERLAGAHGPAAAMVAGAAMGGWKGAGLAGGIMALQNATPIAGRVLYPMTRGTPGSAGALLQTAAEDRRRKERDRMRMFGESE